MGRVVNNEVTPATLFVVRWIFQNITPPDGGCYNELVTPAKALARLAPALDEAFCNWIALSDYRMSKIGHNPQDFLYQAVRLTMPALVSSFDP